MVYVSGEKEDLINGQERESREKGGSSSDEMSMDEVLASIRKIIATDDEEASEAAQPTADDANPEKKEQPAKKQEESQDEDVLELTKEVSSEGEIIDHKKAALDQTQAPESSDSDVGLIPQEKSVSEGASEGEDVQEAAAFEVSEDEGQDDSSQASEVKPNGMDALSEQEFHGEENDDDDVSDFLDVLESEEAEEKSEPAAEMAVHDTPKEEASDEETDAGDEIVFGAEEENEDESASQSKEAPEESDAASSLDQKEGEDISAPEEKKEGLIDEDELEEFMAPQELEEEDVEEFLDDSSEDSELDAFEAPDQEMREEIEVKEQEMTEKKGLISEATKVSAMGALNELKNHVSEASEATKAPNVGGGSLEALVMKGMEPLLKDWLDQNLPALVEKVVQEEIRKLTKGS